MNSMPQEIDDLRRKILQLEIEKTALSKVLNLVKKRLTDLEKELSTLKYDYMN